MNYTYQSFNFRNRQGARPFYDLIASIAAEEFGHIELVSAAINTMLTGAARRRARQGRLAERVKGTRNTQHFIAGGAGALVQDSNNRPWTGDNVFSSGDLVEDLTHNFFLETGARNNKLKVYEMVEHPAARALTGFLLVRGGVHQIAYARALENLTGANLTKLFPSPYIPTDKIPECQPHIKAGLHKCLYRFSQDDFHELAAVFNGTHPETGEELVVADGSTRGRTAERPAAAARRVRERLRARRDRQARQEAAQGRGTARQAHRRRRLSCARRLTGLPGRRVGAIRTPSREVRDTTRGTGTTS